MIDLGTLTGDLGLPGDHSAALGINNCGQIIGSSNHILAHKAKLIKSEPKAVIWNGLVMEPLALSCEGKQQLFSINDQGIATFYKGFDYLLIDTYSKLEYKTNLGAIRNSKINNKKTILISNCIAFVNYLKDGHASLCHFYLDDIFRKISFSPWKDFVVANDINNQNWIVGSATNIFGEQQAILFVPVNK